MPWGITFFRLPELCREAMRKAFLVVEVLQTCKPGGNDSPNITNGDGSFGRIGGQYAFDMSKFLEQAR